MLKSIITSIIATLIGFLLFYIFAITYIYKNIDKERPYIIKDKKSLRFHMKYTSKLHHLAGVPGKLNEEKKPEDYIFAEVSKFKKGSDKILFQGDSYIETLTHYKNAHNILKNFSKKNNVGIINAGIGSYSPSLMSLQYDVLEKDFNILPNIIVAYFDQSDIGDENCRYKSNRIFSSDGKLIRIREEKYSTEIFNYTKIHKESEIFLLEVSNFKKAVKLTNFNLSYKFMKQKSKLNKKIKRIKKLGFKNRSLPKCYWQDIEKPLIENDLDQIRYFSNRIKDYLNKISNKSYIEKIFIVTFPHKANLFPTKNNLGKEIFYKTNVQNIVEKISKSYPNIEHINFFDEIRGNEKYIFENAYIDFDPHLKEKFHSDLFLKTILNKLEIYLNSN
jgi:hypothetical protein